MNAVRRFSVRITGVPQSKNRCEVLQCPLRNHSPTKLQLRTCCKCPITALIRRTNRSLASSTERTSSCKMSSGSGMEMEIFRLAIALPCAGRLTLTQFPLSLTEAPRKTRNSFSSEKTKICSLGIKNVDFSFLCQ